jgi:hypothetical protein
MMAKPIFSFFAIQKAITLVTAVVVCFSAAGQQGNGRPIRVEVVYKDSAYHLMRGGQPYFVKGAGGSSYLDRVAAYGGNSIRTWGTRNGQQILDSAQKYGLTVLMGLGVTAERHGFNYDDTAAVRQQLERVKEDVLKFKNHPALLAWGIGNELNLQYKNPKVWDAVNSIAQMIAEVDPAHPATTVLAGINKSEVDYIKAQCPAIKLLAINTYGGLATLPRQVQAVGWTGPYLVTEWGPTGHWEGLQTTWASAIEETSSEKAAVYKSRYEYSIERDRDQCLGSYVFLWGQKQERTPTWYGLFTESGQETEVMDVMQYLWSGQWPQNRAPHIYSLQLDRRKSTDNITLAPGSTSAALAQATEPDGDVLSYRWEVLPEPTQLSEGGDFEARPKPVTAAIKAGSGGKAVLTAPAKSGAYRLFVYITDGKNNVATANVPFYVK